MERKYLPLKDAEQCVAGIVTLVEAAREKAIAMISVERGYDPRESRQVTFGGAGPLHACALAQALRIPRVMVPVTPGALSALGILRADVVRDYSRTVMMRVSNVEQLFFPDLHFADLEKRGEEESRREGFTGESERSIDLDIAGRDMK